MVNSLIAKSPFLDAIAFSASSFVVVYYVFFKPDGGKENCFTPIRKWTNRIIDSAFPQN